MEILLSEGVSSPRNLQNASWGQALGVHAQTLGRSSRMSLGPPGGDRRKLCSAPSAWWPPGVGCVLGVWI